jgi:hypothetical protein
VAAALGGLQTLALFWALLRSPVFLVLCWTAAAPHLLRAAIDMLLNKRPPPGGRVVALAVGLGCTGVQWPVCYSLCCSCSCCGAALLPAYLLATSPTCLPSCLPACLPSHLLRSDTHPPLLPALLACLQSPRCWCSSQACSDCWAC